MVSVVNPEKRNSKLCGQNAIQGYDCIPNVGMGSKCFGELWRNDTENNRNAQSIMGKIPVQVYSRE